MKNDRWLKFGIIVIAVIFIFVAYRIFRSISGSNQRIDLSGKAFYQYFSGIKKEYSGKLEIINKKDSKNDKNEKVLILEDNSTVYLDATPMYYRDELGKLLLPEKVEVIFPKLKTNYKFEDFSVLYKENGKIKVKRYRDNESKAKEIEDAFIFDGQDMYLFLKETKIKVDDQEYVVPPLSYAYVSYRDYVEIYDYDKDEVVVLQGKEYEQDIKAYTDDYTIDMSIDSLEYEETQQLLIKKLDYVRDFEY